MTIAYFDCFSGASGDMILGSLLDAGVPLAALRGDLSKLPLKGFRLNPRRETREGIKATAVDVAISARTDSVERRLRDFEQIITRSTLPSPVKRDSLRVFRRLAEAEAKVHGTTPEQVHFHELGGVDTLVDDVGAVCGLRLLHVDRVCCSPLPMGSGFVTCRHGTLPIPAPATVELCRGFPVYSHPDLEGELTTPTGAAILTTLADAFGSLPELKVTSVGYGAGKTVRNRPNLLRLLLGESSSESEVSDLEKAFLLETNIDDMNPEFLEDVLERLFEAGVLDAFLVPIIMKKSRPAAMISVLVHPQMVQPALDILFAETTTLGVRIKEVARQCLPRMMKKVQTRFGPIQVKIGTWKGRTVTVSPEYDECKAAARKHGVPLKEVWAEAIKKGDVKSVRCKVRSRK
jgi:uncharacterized protein (TIGR00299 family) protein